MSYISFRIQSREVINRPWVLTERLNRPVEKLFHSGGGRYSFFVLVKKNENADQTLGDLIVDLIQTFDDITYLDGKFIDSYRYSDGKLYKNNRLFSAGFV